MASNIVTNLLAFILVLGFLIFAHEAGHFLLAKLFRVRVLIFSLGFGKRILGFHRGDTDYRVSIIPLGGYVRMAGDNPEEASEGDPGDFLSKPKWQRFLILLAGPAMNIFIAVAFLTGFNMTPTEVVREFPAVIGRVLEKTPAARAGLQVCDRIIEANGEPVEDFDDFQFAIGVRAETPVPLKLIRKGVQQPVVTTVTPERHDTNYGPTGRIGVMPFIEPVIGRVTAGSAAQKAGMREGDRVIAAEGARIEQWADLASVFEKAGGPVRLTVLRAASSIAVTLPYMKDPEKFPGFTLPTRIRQFGFSQALGESVKQNVKVVKLVFFTLGRLFRAQGSVKDLSGPISIARISGEMLRTGWQAVVFLMASISLQLGVLNLLPIPVLDGGHIFILLVEGIARRDLSLRVKERIQQVGFALLAALMIVVLYNDVIQNVMLVRKG